MKKIDLGQTVSIVANVGLLLALGSLSACTDSLPLGEVEILSDQSCSGARCVQFTVSHSALDQDAFGEILINDPEGEAEGTILVFSGGGGTRIWGAPIPEFTEDDASPYEDVIDSWMDAGFRIARIKWDLNWSEGSDVDEGFARLAARPATITNWLADNVAIEDGPMCVGGPSGGAGQTSYMLTHYGLEDKVSLAVPWSGFWMGRIDTGCLDQDPLNAFLHFDEPARRAIDLSYGFSAEEVGPCRNSDASFEDEFLDASISGNGDYFYPNTMVHHVLGGADQVGALGQGITYHEEMLKEGSPHVRIDVLPGIGHGIDRTETGLQRLSDIFLLECKVY